MVIDNYYLEGIFPFLRGELIVLISIQLFNTAFAQKSQADVWVFLVHYIWRQKQVMINLKSERNWACFKYHSENSFFFFYTFADLNSFNILELTLKSWKYCLEYLFLPLFEKVAEIKKKKPAKSGKNCISMTEFWVLGPPNLFDMSFFKKIIKLNLPFSYNIWQNSSDFPSKKRQKKTTIQNWSSKNKWLDILILKQS